MKLRSLALSAIALSCLGEFSVAAQDPNPSNGMDHPKYETEATATKEFHVGQDGSKNHPPGEHNPHPKESPTEKLGGPYVPTPDPDHGGTAPAEPPDPPAPQPLPPIEH